MSDDGSVVYIADTANNRIRAIVGNEVITLAGNGEPGDAGEVSYNWNPNHATEGGWEEENS